MASVPDQPSLAVEQQGRWVSVGKPQETHTKGITGGEVTAILGGEIMAIPRKSVIPPPSLPETYPARRE